MSTPPESPELDLKEELHRLCRADELEAAIELAETQLPPESRAYEETIHYSARLRRINLQIRTGQISEAEAQQLLNKLLADFLAFTRELSTAPDPDAHDIAAIDEPQALASPVQTGMTETRFKHVFFVGHLLIKLIVFGFLYYLRSVGTILTLQFTTIMGTLGPVTLTSLLIMAKHFLSQSDAQPPPTNRHINRMSQGIAFGAMIAYLISIILALRSFATNDGDFQGLISWITWTETLMGGVMGYVVAELFRGEE